MSLLDAMRVGMLVAMIGVVAISVAVVVLSVIEGDSRLAGVWAVVFVLASIIATWVYWRGL